MKLHKLQFIKLLRSGDTPTAIAYARQHFPPFVGHHEKEIQGLMGGLMFSGARLETSPYKHLLDASLWHEIGDLFIKDACLLMGLSVESPLAVAINAGCTALPALLNIKQVATFLNLNRQVRAGLPLVHRSCTHAKWLVLFMQKKSCQLKSI